MENTIYNVPVKVVRSKRKTISIELKPVGILVRAPLRLSDQKIKDFLHQKRDWINRHWKNIEKQKKEMESLEPFTREEINAMAQKAVEIIPQKVKYYASLIGVDYGRITIRNQKTRWGSCTSEGNLNFNCLLVMFPDEVIDSVVVHELCHRKQMNHSAEFYKEVERVFPEYHRCQKWLKDHGRLYLARNISK